MAYKIDNSKIITPWKFFLVFIIFFIIVVAFEQIIKAPLALQILLLIFLVLGVALAIIMRESIPWFAGTIAFVFLVFALGYIGPAFQNAMYFFQGAVLLILIFLFGAVIFSGIADRKKKQGEQQGEAAPEPQAK